MDNIDFDLNLLKIFVTVYESGGIVLASKKLFISQPAISVSIKKLENIVGGKLFIRLPKGVKPTAEGDRFYQNIKSAFKKIELGVEEFEQFSQLSCGKISIGASHDILNFVLMPKVVEFAKKYPNIKFDFIEAIPKKLPQYIDRGDIDIVFLEDNTLPENFDSVLVFELENCFFANKDLLTKKLSKSDFFAQNMTIFKKNSGNFASFGKIFANSDLLNNVKFQVSNFETMKNLCNSCNAIGFAPINYIDKNQFKIIDVDFEIPPTKIFACYPSNDNVSAVLKEFLTMFQNQKMDD